METPRRIIFCCVAVVLGVRAEAQTNGTGIVYTCDATIQAASASACNTLNTTIAALYSAAFTNANATIYIKLGSAGLAFSESVFNEFSYSDFRSHLIASGTDANDATAVASSLPAPNPFGSAMVGLNTATQRALGYAPTSGLDANLNFCGHLGAAGCYDGVIVVSNTKPLFFRTGTIASNQFDFFSAAQHETDEILGTASCAFGNCSGTFGPADYFRYHSNGTRSSTKGTNDSCTSSSSTNACFSLDSMHMLQQYNNVNNGDDAGDWVTNCGTPLVQDTAICAGTAGINISPSAEILVLDVIGYTLRASVPVSPPTPASVSPAVSSGNTQTLTVTYNAPGGYQGLDVVNVLINTALDGRHACYLAYSRPSNALYIVADNGDSTQISGKAMDGTGTVGNSQCTVILSGSSATGNGNTLTLVLDLSFAASFAGNQVVYAAARDTALNNSGWQTIGVHAVPPMPVTFPNPTGMSPSSGNSLNQTITFTYQDQSAATNLQTVWALINVAIDGRAACYVAYYRPGNQVFLYPDNGDGSQASNIVLTGNNTISNSQCTMSAQGSKVQTTGNTLMVTLPITFKTAFAGFKGVWMAASTLDGHVSPWQALGAEAVP